MPWRPSGGVTDFETVGSIWCPSRGVTSQSRREKGGIMAAPKIKEIARNDKVVYVITYTVNGNKIKHFPQYESLGEVERVRQKIEDDLILGKHDDSRNSYRKFPKGVKQEKKSQVITPYQALSKYMDEGGLSESSLKIYKIAMSAAKKLRSNDPDLVRKHLEDLDLSDTVKNRIISCISSAYKFQGKKWVKPVLFKVLEARNKSSEARWLDKNDLELLFSKTDPIFHDFINLSLLTGARPSEVIALTISDFDSARKELTISKNVSHVASGQHLNNTTKTKKNRVIPCNPDLCNLIQSLAKSKDETLIKPINDKKYFDLEFFRRKVKNLQFSDGTYFTPYNLRDTFIFEQVFIHKKDIDIVSAWVGNSPGMIRSNYLSKQQLSRLDVPG